jgi:hypothetical protein
MKVELKDWVDFQSALAKSIAAYKALTPEQRASHDAEQRRSFIRGMCPDHRDYNEWCELVNKLTT